MTLHIAPTNSILVRRDGALGDVFDTTPVVARLRKENPEATIHVNTAYGAVYQDNPHAQLMPEGMRPEHYGRVIDLNMAFENELRRHHAIDAYMRVAFGDDGAGYSKQLVYHYNPEPVGIPDSWFHKAVIFHPARSWPQRTLSLLFWEAFAWEMNRRGFKPIAIGTDQDWLVDGVVNTRVELRHQVAMINMARVYVGSASGPCCYAHCTDTPIVSLCTMSPPAHVTHERHGVHGWGFRGLVAPIECAGCGGRAQEVCTFHTCERGDNICTTLFDPAQVADAAEEMAELYAK